MNVQAFKTHNAAKRHTHTQDCMRLQLVKQTYLDQEKQLQAKRRLLKGVESDVIERLTDQHNDIKDTVIDLYHNLSDTEDDLTR